MSGCREPSELEHLVDWLRALRGKIRGEGIRAAAEAVEDVAVGQYRRGQGPHGEAQPPRKADGAIALKRPKRFILWEGKGLRIHAVGEDVLKHHVRLRPVFPRRREMPPEWRRAAEDALRRVLERGAPT